MSSTEKTSTETTSTTRPAAPAAGRTSGPLGRWRVVDIVVASVLAVVSGVIMFLWDLTYGPLDAALAFYPPLSALLSAAWLFPAVLGALIIRKPGAAVYVMLVAAVVEALMGNAWGGPVTALYGLVQGLGAEVVVAAFLYRRWTLPVMALAGAVSGLGCGVLNLIYSGAGLTTSMQVATVVLAAVSGAVFASTIAWFLAKGLRASGALSPLASGRGAVRV